MYENKKTLAFLGVALVLAILAFVTAPRQITPQAFSDQGEPFFPGFTDPNSATTLEIVSYDPGTGSASPFKVTFDGGKWIIPSHNNYPADAKDRLAKTAAGIIDLRRDDYRSDNVADYEAFGVIDPLEVSATGLTGRGTRVTVKGTDGNVLADFIVGNAVAGMSGARFVRVPSEKRVYAVKTNVDLSGRFEDWVEKDLLKVSKGQIDQVILKDYSINERTLSVDQRDNLELTLKDGVWKANRTGGDQIVDSVTMQGLLTALDELTLAGVRTKPAGLSQSLQASSGQHQITQQDVASLQSKGFYLSRDGQLLSNEGELKVRTKQGVLYTLRFGEVLYGTGLSVSAGADDGAQSQSGGAANRYLFVTANFDVSGLPEPKRPKDELYKNKPDSLLSEADKANKTLGEAYDRWVRDVESARKTVDDLNARFADWYYVISQASFDKLHLSRKDLVVSKKKSEGKTTG
ncbi:MAG: DUF4340 domain-containing protein [Candidatus Zixiibacteriota bacterium]